MAVLHLLLPIARILPAVYFVGDVLILIGMSLILWAVRLFAKAGTTIKPFEASTKMIVSGPYRWSRNPIYLGMVIILLGICAGRTTATNCFGNYRCQKIARLET